MVVKQASRTAVLVCQGRAVAHGRLAIGRFDDPTALPLLRDEERTPVEHACTAVPPNTWPARIDFELLGRQAEAVAVRTVAVDDAVRTGANPQLVILGAGLDGRGWRMPELADVDVFEVDHPASQQDKRDRAGGLQPTARSLRFVPVDFTSTDLASSLAAAGHRASQPTTWVLEGVIPYLSQSAAAATVAGLVTRSAAGSRLIVTYQTGSVSAALGRVLARGVLVVAGRGDPMANERRQSTWTRESVRDVLTHSGLEVNMDTGLRSLAAELSVSARRVGSSRVAVAVTPAA